MYSAEYVACLQRGPMPTQIDLWAEVGRYYHQIHSGMINHLLEQLQVPLLLRGYVAGRESSLQITQRHEPDLHIQGRIPPLITPWNYTGAAEMVAAAVGVPIDQTTSDLEALHIRAREGYQLVTVIEIISPSNKIDLAEMERYQSYRADLLQQGVNVVECDLTRSVKRLVNDSRAREYPYHVAVHLSSQPARLISIPWGESLPRLAIPLQGEVIPVELHAAYAHTYQHTAIANQIWEETGYQEEHLPFPSLIPPAQLHLARQRVIDWRAELTQLTAG